MHQKIRVVVPVHNENTLLPWFLRHYGAFATSIVVWDNGSDDGSAEIAREAGAEVRRFETEGYDEQAVLDRLHETLDESVSYDWLMFPDVDEFIVGHRIHEVLKEASGDVMSPDGFQLVARPEEPPLDAEKPLVGQRRFGYPSQLYTKPIIVRPRAKVRFTAGKHELKDKSVASQSVRGLALFHHDMIDFDLWVYRKTKRPLSERNRKHGWSTLRFCRESSFYVDRWQEENGKTSDLGYLIEALR